MASADAVLEALIAAAGQSQAGRLPEALGEGFVAIDERTPADLLRIMQRLAALLNFYDAEDDSVAAGDWQSFFPPADTDNEVWLQQRDGQCSPHLALLRSFIELYRQPQTAINRLTGRHLDFFYRDVLRLQPAAPRADRAHLLLELKKNTNPLLITPALEFSAGKDAQGVERIYRPLHDTLITPGRVASLRSLYLDAEGQGSVRVAAMANSADGLGAELQAPEEGWPAFGGLHLAAAETGFAIAAPILRLASGQRQIRLILSVLAPQPERLSAARLRDAFELYLTGASQWLGPFTTTPTYANGALTFDLSLDVDREAVVDYQAAIHGYQYDARAPVLQVLLNSANPATGYGVFTGVMLQAATIEVSVSGLEALPMHNDLGALDASKAFMPFGPQPTAGSRWHIDAAEALAKRLTQLSLELRWQDPPANMSSHYSGYSATVNNASFSVAVSFDDAGGWQYRASGEPLFDSADARSAHQLRFSGGGGDGVGSAAQAKEQYARSLHSSAGQWARRRLDSLLLASPVYTAKAMQPETPSTGLISLTLERDFLHQTYRRDLVTTVLEFAKGSGTEVSLLQEPYTPLLQSLSLTYSAKTPSVAISSTARADFASSDIRFYQLGYFGQRREHGYQRSQFDFLGDARVSLLPDYRHRGELLIGLEGLNPGDSVSLLLQVAEGSADPDLPRASLSWSVLCDNYWKPLAGDELGLDSSAQMLTSGIFSAVIPRAATASNTLLPAGLIWLRAATAPGDDVRALPRLIQVANNGLAVRFEDRGNGPGHLAAPLPAGSITRLRPAQVGVKSVTQPYASFGGRLAEGSAAFHTRVAERLRHKDRALGGWDYERLVLQAFPQVHKVKAIRHARPGHWRAAGHVTLVVIAALDNRNAVDPLQPRVDSHTLASIGEFLAARCGAQVQLHVCNPRYRQVKLGCRVRFRPGLGFNHYQRQLQADLKRVLSPWAYLDGEDIEFGGRIHKSVLIDVIDELPYVDFISEVTLSAVLDTDDSGQDSMVVQAQAPDEILVSAREHGIEPLA